MQTCLFLTGLMAAVTLVPLPSSAKQINSTDFHPQNYLVTTDLPQRSLLEKAATTAPKAFHLFSHGRPGELLIGGKWLDAKAIAALLADKTDGYQSLYVWGCEFARGKKGRDAVAYLQKKTGINISASNDVTGVNGDWALEVGQPFVLPGLNDYAHNLQCTPCGGIVGGTGPSDDLDGDGVCNNVDVDDDNDGLSDTAEGTNNLNTVTNSTFTGSTAGWTLAPEWVHYFSQLGGRNDDVPNAKSAYQNVVLKNPYTSYAILQFKVRTNDYIASSGALSTRYMNFAVYIGGTRVLGIANPANNGNVTITRDVAGNSIISNFWVNGALLAASTPKAINRDQTYAIQIAFNPAALPANGRIEFRYNANGDDVFVDDVYYYLEGNLDTDGDGIPNHLDSDSDNDGIPDAVEACGDNAATLSNCRLPYSAAADPDGPDADNCPDGKVVQSCTTPKDTDGDGTPDYLDTDSDGDGCSDAKEAGTSGSTVNDNTTNSYGAPAATPDGLTNTGCAVPSNQNWITASVQTACLPPAANGDSSTGNAAGSDATLDILVNDRLSDGTTPATPANTSVTLTNTGLPAGSTVSANTVTVPGEGAWTYDPATGNLTFTPENEFKGSPTPLSYILTENATGLTDNATVSVAYEHSSLPVRLADFAANREGSGVLLSWSTTEEINSAYFEVQHSINAQNWMALDKVAAPGESSGLERYRYTHGSPTPGINYYRLKMVDKDGTFVHSKIRSILLEGEIKLKLFPNPASEMLRLENAGAISHLEIYSLAGTRVMQVKEIPVNGINVNGLPAGMYIIKVLKHDGSFASGKIMIQN